MTAPEPPPVTITGGIAGTQAITEDLERVVRIIDAAADAVAECGAGVRETLNAAMNAQVQAVPEVRVPLGSAQDELSAASTGPEGTQTLSLRLWDLRDRVAAVARAYLDAEEQARERVSAVWRLRTGIRDGLEAATFPLRLQAGLWGKTPQGQIFRHTRGLAPLGVMDMPRESPATTGLLRRDTVRAGLAATDLSLGELPSRYESLVALLAVTTGLLESLLGEPRPQMARRLGPSTPVMPPTGVGDLVAGIGQVPRTEFGAVLIDTVTAADGSESYIVSIPGTQDWTLTDPHVKDLDGNLRAVLGGASDAMQLVVDAMAAHRIPADAPVMLVGHSQGGMVATAVAAMPEVQERYTIGHVVTAGAPVGRLPHPPRTGYLHVSNWEDVVPGLAAAAPPDAANVITASATLRAGEDAELARQGRSFVGAHDLSSYVAAGHAVDAAAGASIAAWRAGAAPHLGGASATRTAYAPTRRPEPWTSMP